MIVYVDVDETLISNAGSEQQPIPDVVAHLRRIHADGVKLYCWSAGGAEYARKCAALAGVVNGKTVDVSALVSDDADVRLITSRDEEGVEIIRHSTAHLLAHAVKQLFPEAQVTIGPVIEDGFYYDFYYPQGFSEKDLEAIENRMSELAKADHAVAREEMPRDGNCLLHALLRRGIDKFSA